MVVTIQLLVCPDCGENVSLTVPDGNMYLCPQGHFHLLEELKPIPVKEASDEDTFRFISI